MASSFREHFINASAHFAEVGLATWREIGVEKHRKQAFNLVGAEECSWLPNTHCPKNCPKKMRTRRNLRNRRNLPVSIFNYLRVFNMLRECCGERVPPEEPCNPSRSPFRMRRACKDLCTLGLFSAYSSPKSEKAGQSSRAAAPCAAMRLTLRFHDRWPAIASARCSQMMPPPASAFNRFLVSEKTAYQKLQVPLTGR